MSDSEIRNFIFENYYNGVRFSKKNNYYSMKRLKKKTYRSLQPNL